MTESDEILLEGWNNLLEVQCAHFKACIVKQIGHAHIRDEISSAFLEFNENNLVKPTIEKAVATFIRTGSWPALTHHEYLHLIFRVDLARKVIAVIRPGPLARFAAQRLFAKTVSAAAATQRIEKILPDLENRERTIRWLLVDLWNEGGKRELAEIADDSLKPAPLDTPSGRAEVVIYAPLQMVKAAIISLEVSAGERLESQSENTLSFSGPSKSLVADNLYGRVTYTLSPESRGVRVLMRGEVLVNYGTASESSTPVDSTTWRIASQNFLMQIKAAAEKSS